MQAHAATIHRALDALYQGIHRILADEPTLSPTPVPVEFARVPGCWRGSDVEMRVRRYVNDHYESITLAGVYDQAENLHTVTLIGLPGIGRAAPVIGLDAVAMGPRWSLLAVDLAITDEAYWQQYCAPPLTRFNAQMKPLVQMRKRPAFAAQSFSPLTLIGAVLCGHEHRAALETIAFLRHGVAPILQHAVTTGPASRAPATQRNLAWRRAERTNRKEQKALATLFGADRAQRIIEDFLFPLPQDTHRNPPSPLP